MLPEVKELLSRHTTVPVPINQQPIQEIKMSSEAWKIAKVDIDAVFSTLKEKGLIVGQGAGYTQREGFDECAHIHYGHPDGRSIQGFCFYTRQDLERAERTSSLPLGFWGAPDGNDERMLAVGELITRSFTEAGIQITWNNDPGTRPVLLLHRYSQQN